MNINQLRERRNECAKAARDLVDGSKDRKWTDEDQSKYDEYTGEVISIDQQITNLQKLSDIEADEAFDQRAGDHENNEDPLSERAITNAWARRGERGLSEEQANRMHNTMSTTTDSQGGYTVQSEVAKSIIESLKAFGGMREVAEVIRTSKGNPMSFPTSDGTSEVGELVAQNAPASDEDPDFGTVSLNPYKYGSKVITVPIELLQDSEVDIEAFIRGRIQTRIGRITNQHFTTGTGSGQPRGVVTASGVGKVGTTGQTTTVIYDDLVDLQESVDIAYQNGNQRFMFAQTMRKVVRKLKDGDSRPIWTPNYDLGASVGSPDLLLGSPVKINNDMPAPGASNKSIVFGDLSRYKIRDVMQVSLFRFTDSVYTKKGQVGFLAWTRAGGNLVDVDAVKHYQHSAT